MYVNNPKTRCKAEYCSELGRPVECPLEPVSDCKAEPGCVCIDGYVRNNFGVCISTSEFGKEYIFNGNLPPLVF